MKKLFLLLSALSFAATMRGLGEEDASADEETKEGKVQYVLILPQEKTPELVKPNEQNPFGGIADERDKQTVTGEELKVAELLRSLPVVGRSRRGWVLMGDIILRQGEKIPPVLPNQSVELQVLNISPDAVELMWVEKKPTGLLPRTLIIPIDVTPKVSARLPGQSGKTGEAAMGIFGSLRKVVEDKIAERVAERTLRATPVEDQPPGRSGVSPASAQPENSGNALLNLFFGNQVKGPPPSDKPDGGNPPAGKDDAAKP